MWDFRIDLIISVTLSATLSRKWDFNNPNSQYAVTLGFNYHLRLLGKKYLLKQVPLGAVLNFHGDDKTCRAGWASHTGLHRTSVIDNMTDKPSVL